MPENGTAGCLPDIVSSSVEVGAVGQQMRPLAFDPFSSAQRC